MKTKLQSPAIFFLILVLFMLSCAPVTELIGTPDTGDSPQSPPEQGSASLTSPPATETPTPLPTVPPVLPVTVGTSVPQPGTIISPENVEGIVEIAAWTGHGCSVFSVTFSPDSSLLASTSCDQTVRVWDLANGGESRILGQPEVEFGTAFTSDSTTLAAWSFDSTVNIYDIASGDTLHTFEYIAQIFSAAISPDGKTLVGASEDGTIRMWDLTSGNELANLNANLGEKYGLQLYVRDVSFSPNGALLASTDEDEKVRLWDLDSSTITRTMEVPFARSADFSADGSMLWVTTISPDFYHNYTEDYSVQFFDPASGNKLSELRLIKKESPGVGVKGAALSPNGKVLVLAFEDGTFVLYDAASGSELRRITAHIDRVDSIAFSPDGKFIATGSADGDRTVKLWGIYP